ncbi:DUF3784 domain-containing protein [Vagococcus fessus]|uniref:DUF3784 domain-containing protein n=1 Tax=Vagococcus fessus TaxID=120370 RepID=A0A430AC28_9ENTE|nr:DUF3784 domain-containing protein [Vagococcus fessus]RSU04769.1 hypothetical protein CBF31_01750 [Vagococcus fessus]
MSTETIVLSFIMIPIISLLLICGVQFYRGKWFNLIAGYNTASPQEKSRAEERNVGKKVALVCFLSALSCFTMLLKPTEWVIAIAIASILLVTIWCLISLNKK